MPKKPVRVPAARAGRNVRWTLEVSADGGKEAGGARKVSPKRTASARAKQAPAKTGKKRALPVAKKDVAAAGPASRGPAYKPKESAAAAPADPARPEDSWPPRKSSASHWPQVVAVGAAAAVVLAALAMTRDPGHSPSVDLSAAPASQPAVAVAEPRPVVASVTRREPGSPTREAQPQPPREVQPQPRAASVIVARAEERKPAVEKAPPLETHSVAPVATTAVNVAPLAVAPVSAAPVTTSAGNESPVTITGCLEASTDGDEFRLTDTDGAEAPKSRGWRSGFLKKRPAPVALVAAPDAAGLRKFVGHRVTATGPLEDREMRVRSFRSAGALCD